MKEDYVYPVRVKKVKGGQAEYNLVDFPAQVGCCDNETDVILRAAQELLAINIINCEEAGIDLPEPSMGLGDADVMYIHVWMPYFRKITKLTYVKKTVTIPQWLDIMAKEKKVNFSGAMVRGIKEELGIRR